MKRKAYQSGYKVITVGMALMGAVLYFAVFPVPGNDTAQQYPEFSHCFYPWLIFLWLTAVLCYIVLILAWKIAGNIGRDNSFCRENSVMKKNISVLKNSKAKAIKISTLTKLCAALACQPGDILEFRRGDE